jgi:hypothetical protein
VTATVNPTVFDIEALDRDVEEERSRSVAAPEKQVRISLAADWPEAVPLRWNAGHPNPRETIIWLHPGQSVVQPLGKAQALFGPFSVPLEYATADERTKKDLKKFFDTEKKRYLDRYDWPRIGGDQKPDMRKSGPHRSPDITVTILEADGSESQGIRLYQLYKIGDWDPDKDTFAAQETLDAAKAAHAVELANRDAALEAMRREMAELKGFVHGKAAK